MNFFSFLIQEKEKKQKREKRKRKKGNCLKFEKVNTLKQTKINDGSKIEFEKNYTKVKNIVKCS